MFCDGEGVNNVLQVGLLTHLQFKVSEANKIDFLNQYKWMFN